MARPSRIALSSVVPLDASAPATLPNIAESGHPLSSKMNTAPVRTTASTTPMLRVSSTPMQLRLSRPGVPLAKHLYPLVRALVLGCEFFRACESLHGFVDSVVRKFTLRTVPAQTVFSSMGEIASELYLIKEGKVSILSNDQTVLTTRTSGELIGELALLSKGVRTAHMRADCNTELLVLSADHFYDLCDEFTECEELMKNAAANRVLSDSQTAKPAHNKLNTQRSVLSGGDSKMESDFESDHGLRRRFYLLDYNHSDTITAASIAAMLNRVDTTTLAPHHALHSALRVLQSQPNSLNEIMEYLLAFSPYESSSVTENEFFLAMKCPVNEDETGGFYFAHLKTVLDYLITPKERGFELLKSSFVRFVCAVVMMVLLPLTLPLAAVQSRSFHRQVSTRKRALDVLENEYAKAFNRSLHDSLNRSTTAYQVSPRLRTNRRASTQGALASVRNMEAEVKVRRQELSALQATAPLAEQVFIHFAAAVFPTSLARRLRYFVTESSRGHIFDVFLVIVLPWLLASLCYVVSLVMVWRHSMGDIDYMASFEADGGLFCFVLIGFVQAINVCQPKSQRSNPVGSENAGTNNSDRSATAVQQMMLNQYSVVSTQANIVTAQDLYNWIEYLHRSSFRASRKRERAATVLTVVVYVAVPGIRRRTVGEPFFACDSSCQTFVVLYQLCSAALYFLLLVMLADIAREYKQKLSRLRLMTRLTSRSQSAQVGLPYLSLDFAANVDAWLQLRRAVLENDEALPSVALGTCAMGVSLVLIASLLVWNIITAIVGFRTFGSDPHNDDLADNDELLVRGSHILASVGIGCFVIYAMTVVRDINSLSESHAELLLQERWSIAARLRDVEASFVSVSSSSKLLEPSPLSPLSEPGVLEEKARELSASLQLLDRLVPVILHRYHVTTILWFPVTTGFFIRLGLLSVTGIVTLVVRLIVD